MSPAEYVNAQIVEPNHSSGNDTTPPPSNSPEKNITTIVYALQALGLMIPFALIAGVVLNYVKQEDVANTWLESHFRWQIRTFWFALLWFSLGVLTLVLVMGYFILFANAVWLIYRIIKGWLRLSEGKDMPV